MCPHYQGEEVDMGPHCCDLMCFFGIEATPKLWEGDDS